jgi:hypothetical protein
MEREGTKHGPLMDDELKHETEGLVRGQGPTHAEEWKEPEPSAPDEDATYADPRAPGTPAGLTNEDVELRSELASILQPLQLPASREDVLLRVTDADATAALRARVEQLSDRSYDNLGEVLDDLDLVERQRF